MRISPSELDAIVAGTVDLAFRRWDRPRVLPGTRMRTRVGLVEVTAVDPVDPTDLTEDDARRAGATDLAAVHRGLAAQPGRPVFRVGLRFAGEDPRAVLRRTPPTPAEVAELQARLDRLDRASPIGLWTARTLQLVDAHPERRAPDLAAEVGRPVPEFKRDVRKLKELGLTESLDIGYRLSVRGEAVVDAARRAAGGRARRRAPRPEGTPLPSIGAPATRALRAAGLTTLEAVAGSSRAELLAMHGVGPIALARLDTALGAAGLVLAD
ncbi:hypothetical protein ASG36_01465 [Geodermatophilus sp. Leaf369]|uniref:hypothetical protein n=1 Tax=Geodermatophilus sp. Leaf369 TaxID=1736354 RepID=UPI000700D06F|nr:hypothetical protein [Geodermatophilus sp. Leaf369]KQS59746.1 hypothetical protein ASG36_01465 [Geodermatophilus sp. Leaf369]